MRRRRAVFLALALAPALAAAAPLAAQPLAPLPIALTVAVENGSEVVTAAWLAARMRQADTIFSPSGLSFTEREHLTMDASHARMEDRPDRHALGGMLVPRSINVFVVASLRDVDDPSIFRQGVHWRSLTHPGTHYVILSMISGETTLAHELGHFFGNPHSPVPNNIMSYERDGTVPPFFDERQLRRIRARSRAFLSSGELVR